LLFFSIEENLLREQSLDRSLCCISDHSSRKYFAWLRCL